MLSFPELFEQQLKVRGTKIPKEYYKGDLLSLDPGETTGWCYFRGMDLIESGQLKTPEVREATREINHLIITNQPSEIVIEEYRVYGWKTDQHAWNALITPRIIGAVESLCFAREPEIPIIKQPAHVAKQFCTDTKLKQWGFYQKGMKHARDAIRHACYYMLFGGKHR